MSIIATPIHATPLLPSTWNNLFYPPSQGVYTYFDRAKTCPFVGGSLLTKAAWAADASMLAYARFGAAPMPTAAFDAFLTSAGFSTPVPIGDWSRPGTQAYFAANPQFALVAFRGTERDDPLDSLTDADFVLVHEPDFRLAADEHHLALRHLAFVDLLFQPSCRVHQGFQRAMLQVWQQVHSLVSQYRQQFPQSEICFTGHSLGGALAMLAFSRFADQHTSLYTFGCPRTGDEAFCDRVLENAAHRVFRFVNLNDSVAHVYPELLGYRHAPLGCFRFDEDGNLEGNDGQFQGDAQALGVAIRGIPRAGVVLESNAPSGLVDHSPARYCIRLWNCVP